MWKNYLNTVLRGIWKYKAFSAINIFGLAIGIACCLMILLFVQYEFSYDRHNVKLDQIYRLNIHGVIAGNEINAVTTPYPMAATLIREYPEIEYAARFRQFFIDTLVSRGDIRYQEQQIFHADPSLFDVFTFDFIAGDPDTALNDPFSIVIEETIAEKYFADEEALGQSLTFNNNQDYQITGITKKIPENAHVHPEILVSFSSDDEHDSTNWVSNNIQTYFILREGSSPEELEVKLQDVVSSYVAPQIEAVLGINIEEFLNNGGVYEYNIQPATDIHLYSDLEGEFEANGNANYVYTFLAVALFVLLLACINFMNLSTARSANRAREIGVRKVMGAYRGQLLVQFLGESMLISLVALVIALPLVYLALPAFNALIEKSISLSILFSAQALLLLFVFTLAVGVISGSYPALFLSKFHPQEVLKGKFSGGSSSSWFRAGLVILQFSISIALVSATLIVYDQLNFMRSKELGFQKEQLIVVQRAGALGDQRESFVEQLKRQPGVVNAAATTHVPGESVNQNVYILEGRPMSDTHAFWQFSVGWDYIETLGLEIVEGRTFSREFGNDTDAYILNETAVRELEIDNPTEHNILEPDPDGLRSGPIIGVVKDFHFQSLHQEIRPTLLRIQNFSRYVIIRLQPDNIQETISDIEDTWEQMTNSEPFQYSFLDEDFDNLHQGDRKMGEVFSGFSALAILIACLGLYGLASYTTEQRTKEIGVRKTLGASVSNIVLMISREFLVLVLIALAIAVPITWFAMNLWLQIFSYRIDVPISSFAYSGFLALLVAFATVSFQSIRTALTNPALSLRDE
ncbi:MAG: FtsX-like permease family protein [Pseudomonadales bacterium]|nr:FtsX-like permease family protein [Pseudomonadales bacterium]